MVGLTTFEAPLLRLILCGGGGLPAAWGPLLNLGYAAPWNPLRGEAVDPMFLAVRDPLAAPEHWSLPLDASSPWPTRLAAIAAWMVAGAAPPFATIHHDLSGLVVLAQWRGPWHEPERWTWRCDGHAASASFDLPTLAQRRSTHPPVVALLLALYDVPEIRARVGAP